MRKIWVFIIPIVIIIIIGMISLNILVNYKLEIFYKDYYNIKCNTAVPSEFLEPEQIQIAELCENTVGCYTTCGSACPPKQKLSILNTFQFFKEKSCIEVCVPQCVCPYGSEFTETGCKKR